MNLAGNSQLLVSLEAPSVTSHRVGLHWADRGGFDRQPRGQTKVYSYSHWQMPPKLDRTWGFCWGSNCFLLSHMPTLLHPTSAKQSFVVWDRRKIAGCRLVHASNHPQRSVKNGLTGGESTIHVHYMKRKVSVKMV